MSMSIAHRTEAPSAPSSLVARLVRTDGDVATAAARVALGLVMFPHGAQKVLGWFGGYGLAGTYAFFTSKLGIPGPFAALAIATEFVAPIALVLGVGARVAALGVAALMLVATLLVHVPNGFFMNWFGNQAGEGFEYHLLAIALATVVLIRGAGAASVDRKLSSR